jgi:hypothetical protein
VSAFLDALARYTPDTPPIRFDESDHARMSAAAEAASVEYGPTHPLHRAA